MEICSRSALKICYCAGCLRQNICKTLQRLFEILRANRLRVRSSKGKTGVTKIKFLEYNISARGLQMQHHLVHVILDWPPAKSIHDVRQYFGQANLYRKRFSVSTDASKYAVESTLEQERHPVAFLSHRLSDTEIRWDTGDQELSSFSLALREWNVYLKSRRISVSQ